MLRLHRMTAPQSPTPVLGLAAANAAQDEHYDSATSSNAQCSPNDPGMIGQPKRQAIVARVLAQARACRAWPKSALGMATRNSGSYNGFAGLPAFA